MTQMKISGSIEMYLKTISELDAHAPVAISQLAGRMGVTQVSATEMVKRLEEQGLLNHLPYKGVILTDEGRQIAYNVIRRQRLWECFLYDHLKIEWSKVREFACDLEHATAPEVTEALAVFLGQPTLCPHGSPIPNPDGSFTAVQGRAMSEIAVGQSGHILAVLPSDPDVLEYLQAQGVLPGVEFTMLEAAPLQGPLRAEIDGIPKDLGYQVAQRVLVQPIE